MTFLQPFSLRIFIIRRCSSQTCNWLKLFQNLHAHQTDMNIIGTSAKELYGQWLPLTSYTLCDKERISVPFCRHVVFSTISRAFVWSWGKNSLEIALCKSKVVWFMVGRHVCIHWWFSSWDWQPIDWPMVLTCTPVMTKHFPFVRSLFCVLPKKKHSLHLLDKQC